MGLRSSVGREEGEDAGAGETHGNSKDQEEPGGFAEDGKECYSGGENGKGDDQLAKGEFFEQQAAKITSDSHAEPEERDAQTREKNVAAKLGLQQGGKPAPRGNFRTGITEHAETNQRKSSAFEGGNCFTERKTAAAAALGFWEGEQQKGKYQCDCGENKVVIFPFYFNSDEKREKEGRENGADAGNGLKQIGVVIRILRIDIADIGGSDAVDNAATAAKEKHHDTAERKGLCNSKKREEQNHAGQAESRMGFLPNLSERAPQGRAKRI